MNTNINLKAFIALCRTFHYVSDIAKKDIKNYGISLTEFETLELLFHKGPQPIQAIGKQILLTSGSMTYVVDQLEKKQLVKRVICDKDKRIIYAELTSNGKTLMEDAFPQHEKCISDIFSSLSEVELKNLLQTLKKISLYDEKKDGSHD